MARIEAEQLAIGNRVAEIKFVGADDVAFGAEAEELAFDCIEVDFWIERLGKNFVEGLAE